MTTPQQFIEQFWQEKDKVYEETNVRLTPVYTNYFAGPLLTRALPGMLHRTGDNRTIDEVQHTDTGAMVITTTRFDHSFSRMRYHLSPLGQSWKITRMQQPCSACLGTRVSATATCTVCNGEGWCD